MLWKLNFPTPKLMSLGAELGSDADFETGQAAWAEGEGRFLNRLPPYQKK